MKIALTGGSGFIGSHLAQKLVSEGHKLRVLVRKNSNTELLKKLGVKLVYGDVTDKQSLSKLVYDVDIVYHLAAKVYKGPPEEFWRVNYHGTKNMLEVCMYKKLQRFVFTSTVTVMGSIADPPADETYPYNPTSPYEQSKCAAEKIALQYHQKYDIPVTIIRPAVVYGPRNMYQLKLYRWIQKSRAFIGCMDNWVHLSHIENLLAGITLAAQNPKAIGEVYIIADETPILWREYFQLIAEALGTNPPNKQIPIWTVKAFASSLEITSRMFRTTPAIVSSWVQELTKNFAYNISKARKDLGYNPTVTLKEGLRQTIEWYKRNGYLK